MNAAEAHAAAEAEGLTCCARNSTGFKCVSRTNNGSKPFQAA